MIGKSHKYQELSLLSQLNQQIIHLSKMIILYKITQKLKVVNVYIKMPYIILGISLVSKNNVFVTKLYIDYMYKLSNKGLATMTNDSSYWCWNVNVCTVFSHQTHWLLLASKGHLPSLRRHKYRPNQSQNIPK